MLTSDHMVGTALGELPSPIITASSPSASTVSSCTTTLLKSMPGGMTCKYHMVNIRQQWLLAVVRFFVSYSGFTLISYVHDTKYNVKLYYILAKRANCSTMLVIVHGPYKKWPSNQQFAPLNCESCFQRMKTRSNCTPSQVTAQD